MSPSWNVDFLTATETAQLNPQTLSQLDPSQFAPAVRIRHLIPIATRTEIRYSPKGRPTPRGPKSRAVAQGQARERLIEALERVDSLLGCRTATRRGELAEALQDLAARSPTRCT
jgi:hypothetical protein